jgi:hypothetical protein
VKQYSLVTVWISPCRAARKKTPLTSVFLFASWSTEQLNTTLCYYLSMNRNGIYRFFTVLLLVLVATALFFAQNNQVSPSEMVTDTEPYRATLAGEYVCLPHKDTSSPQTDECIFGLRTEGGEYYAIDFYLMSQMHKPLSIGDTLSAAGVVTAVERLSSDHWQKYDVKGIFSVTDSLVVAGESTGSYACPADAMICPDGSAVGRQGSKCEFVACPTIDATSTRVTTYLGGTVTGLNVSLSPQAIVSDSRCPAEVTCIWAGTVEVQTVLSTQVSHGELTLTLGEPETFGEYSVMLIEVTPAKTEAVIPDSSYRFTFEIELIQS